MINVFFMGCKFVVVKVFVWLLEYDDVLVVGVIIDSYLVVFLISEVVCDVGVLIFSCEEVEVGVIDGFLFVDFGFFMFYW